MQLSYLMAYVSKYFRRNDCKYGIRRDISYWLSTHFFDHDKIEEIEEQWYLKVYFSLTWCTCCGRQVRLKKLSKHLMLVHLFLLVSRSSTSASIITSFRYRLFASRIRSSSRSRVIRSRSITESESNYDDARRYSRREEKLLRYTKETDKSGEHSQADPCSPRVRRLMRGILSLSLEEMLTRYFSASPRVHTWILRSESLWIKRKNLNSFFKLEERRIAWKVSTCLKKKEFI